jgi:hypothetical protein
MQIIVKEKGIFTNVTSPTAKAKFRLLFEVAPLEFFFLNGKYNYIYITRKYHQIEFRKRGGVQEVLSPQEKRKYKKSKR